MSDSGSSSAAMEAVGRRHTAAAEAAITTDITAKTAQLPTVVMITAADAGPASPAEATSAPEKTLAAVSSSGPSTMLGSAADWAGRIVVTAVAVTIAAMYAPILAFWWRNTAVTSMPTLCTARPHLSTEVGPWRWIKPPTANANAVAGMSCATVTADASRTPPAVYAYAASAIHTASSDNRNPATARHRRRSDRLRQARAEELDALRGRAHRRRTPGRHQPAQFRWSTT